MSQIAISKETLRVLKNFSAINENLKIEPGSKIFTINKGMNVYGEYDGDESWPVKFDIYDLPQFLRCLNTYDNVSVDFGEISCDIMGDTGKIQYAYTDEKVIKLEFPRGSPKVTDWIIENVELKKERLQEVLSTASILNSTLIQFVTEDGKLKIKTSSRSTPSFGETIVCEDDSLHLENPASLSTENFSLIDTKRDYTVSIAKSPAIRFRATDIQYYMSLETTN